MYIMLIIMDLHITSIEKISKGIELNSHKQPTLCMKINSITCIQRPSKGSNKSGLLQEVIFTCRFY